MNNHVLAIVGIVGGLLCALADCLLDLKGANNKKLGNKGIIDSKWSEMSHWRFVASGLVVMVAIPMYSCGFIALMNLLPEKYSVLANVSKIIFLCGAMGGFLIHTFLCLMPTVYNEVSSKGSFELAESVINRMFRQIYVPFFLLYSLLVIVPTGIVVYIILAWLLPIPMWCIILNPVVFQIIGLLLRATKLKCFIDAPSICAASLGLAMYGVLALIVI